MLSPGGLVDSDQLRPKLDRLMEISIVQTFQCPLKKSLPAVMSFGLPDVDDLKEEALLR